MSLAVPCGEVPGHRGQRAAALPQKHEVVVWLIWLLVLSLDLAFFWFGLIPGLGVKVRRAGFRTWA